jgi:hypothetical protein
MGGIKGLLCSAVTHNEQKEAQQSGCTSKCVSCGSRKLLINLYDPDEWRIEYRDLPNGAEIRYSSMVPDIAQAVHEWFDAQLSDHGRHAMPGHLHGLHHGQ